jgi:hypothetical protein
MLVCARLRYVATKECGANKKLLYEHEKMQEYEKELNKAKVDIV